MATTPVPDSTSIPAAPPAQRTSSASRMLGIFFEPRKTFAEIAARPNWIVPMIVMTLISAGLSIAINQRVDWGLVFQRNLERSPRAARSIEQLPPERQQVVVMQGARVQKISRYVQGFVGTLALAAFLAGVYLGIFNTVANARLSYSSAFGIVTYALLPISLRELAGIPVILMVDRNAIDPANYFYSNLGALLDSSAPLWQARLLTSLDLFVLWAVVLVGIGFAAANPKKIGLATGLAISFAVYAFFVLVPTAIGAIFS